MKDQATSWGSNIQTTQRPLSGGKKGKKMQTLHRYLALAVFTLGIAAFPVDPPNSEALSARTPPSQPSLNIRMRL